MSQFKGYKECQEKYMDETMKKFENKKLIISGKRYVKDRKQAVAIALDTAQRKCKYSSKDYSEIKEKVNMFLHNDDRKISEKKIPLTNVIETKVLVKYYLKKSDKRKAKKLKDDLLERVIRSGKDGIKVSKNIFEVLNEINLLLKN